MTIYLIRHGETFGNQKKRYIGTTDEPLCHSGRCFLAQTPSLLAILKKYKGIAWILLIII